MGMIHLAMITVAVRLRLLGLLFALQLREPFNADGWAGLTPAACSLGHRFRAYSFSSALLIISLFVPKFYAYVKMDCGTFLQVKKTMNTRCKSIQEVS